MKAQISILEPLDYSEYLLSFHENQIDITNHTDFLYGTGFEQIEVSFGLLMDDNGVSHETLKSILIIGNIKNIIPNYDKSPRLVDKEDSLLIAFMESQMNSVPETKILSKNGICFCFSEENQQLFSIEIPDFYLKDRIFDADISIKYYQ